MGRPAESVKSLEGTAATAKEVEVEVDGDGGRVLQPVASITGEEAACGGRQEKWGPN